MKLEQHTKNFRNSSFLSKKRRLIFPHPQSGFTLMELLVVISIIGLLGSIVMVQVSTTRRAARDSKRVSSVVTLLNGLDQYYGNNGYYPPAEIDYPGGFPPGAKWYYRVDDSTANRFLPSLKDNGLTNSDAKDPLNRDNYYLQYTDAQRYGSTPPANTLDDLNAMQGVCGTSFGLGVVIQFWLESDTINKNPNIKLCANSPLTPPYYYCACRSNTNTISGWPY
jgi:prepilin-type N-terminal cleavage/methylation domain-containing protein